MNNLIINIATLLPTIQLWQYMWKKEAQPEPGFTKLCSQIDGLMFFSGNSNCTDNPNNSPAMKVLHYKTKVLLCTFRVALLSYLILTSMIIVSCGNSSKRNISEDGCQQAASVLRTDIVDNIKEETVDIPITVNLSNNTQESHDMYLIFKIINEDDNIIYIDATSPYYNSYVSKQRFDTYFPAWVDEIGYMEYLMLDLDIVNNTPNRLDIQELDINIESSKLDSLPYIYIVPETSKCNTISFYNASWFNWKGFTFSYSILKNGEEFDGVYKFEKHIKYFDDFKTVDLLHDLMSLGYDFEKMCRIVYGDDFNLDEYTKRCNLSIINKEFGEGKNYETICYLSEEKEVFWPFDAYVYEEYKNAKTYRGVANLYGRIRFDINGEEVLFRSKISLSDGCEYGAVSNLDDSFDVSLKTIGNDYVLRYPYTTVIEPYGAERVSIVVKAEKSSNHVFYINAKNRNELNIRSKDIRIHYMSPRNYLVDNGSE